MPLLQAAVAEVEAGSVGGGAAKVTGFGSMPAFEAHVLAAVAALPAALEAVLLEQAGPPIPTHNQRISTTTISTHNTYALTQANRCSSSYSWSTYASDAEHRRVPADC